MSVRVPDERLDELAALAEAVKQTTYDEPWWIGVEPRREDAVAIKSGIYTIVTVADYFDGGSDEQEAALALIAAASTDLAALVSDLRAARADNQRLREALGEIQHRVRMRRVGIHADGSSQWLIPMHGEVHDLATAALAEDER